MKFRKNKKGFTIVELVIVIGVIGILSAILIPTFTNLTSQANAAAAQNEVQQAYNDYVIKKTEAGEDNIYTIGQVAVKRDGLWYTYNNGWGAGSSTKPTNATDVVHTYVNIQVYENVA